MFDKFGPMDYEELIRTAKSEKEEGDLEALRDLALENGLDEEDAEDYMDSLVDTMCTPFQAAAAKLRMEGENLKLKGFLGDWRDLIIEECMESEGEHLCLAVRKKEKSLAECMARLLAFSFEHKAQVPDAIVGITKVVHNGREEKMRGPVYTGVPSRADVRRIARDYYMGR